MEAAARGSAIQEQFRVYRTEIDAYNDRRERLIKASRDVTTQSKRLIFVLHRFPHDALPLSSGESSRSGKAGARIIKEATEKRDEIIKILVETALREGLSESTIFAADAAADADGAKTVVRDGDAEIGRAYRHERSLGGGLEEFVSIGCPMSDFEPLSPCRDGADEIVALRSRECPSCTFFKKAHSSVLPRSKRCSLLPTVSLPTPSRHSAISWDSRT